MSREGARVAVGVVTGGDGLPRRSRLRCAGRGKVRGQRLSAAEPQTVAPWRRGRDGSGSGLGTAPAAGRAGARSGLAPAPLCRRLGGAGTL